MQKLVRLAKYLEIKGLTPSEISALLQQTSSDQRVLKQAKAPNGNKQFDTDMSAVSDTEYAKVNKKRDVKRKHKEEKKADDTESDSDFESIKMQTRGER